ncbi:MAG TPA: toxin [Candidatus Paceibacterota bacterium]
MRELRWNLEKNEWLKRERNVSFEDVVVAINSDRLLDEIPHPNTKKYPHQRIYVVSIRNYAYVVPFVVNEEKIFLKTVIASRTATKRYLVDKKLK